MKLRRRMRPGMAPSMVTFLTLFVTATGLSTTGCRRARTSTTVRMMAVEKKGYDPKWKKLETLADQMGSANTVGAAGVGLIGTVTVNFKEGNQTRTTMAIPGQPLSDVAAQAGQFIKYGCGKGECGTCESLANGKWIRPCSTNVLQLDAGEELTITVKAGKRRAKKASKFFFRDLVLIGREEQFNWDGGLRRDSP
eukprot:FR739285.1.p1 GENE.FR739285.1~~FR739285.1.p1  ORF type:complete len:195 (+),score=21.41 FR739285.1:13-597(+)